MRPSYEAVADLERRCAKAKHLRHDDGPGVAVHAAVMLLHAALLATDARYRPNEDVAQAQLEANFIRAVCLWHCASGGLRYTRHGLLSAAWRSQLSRAASTRIRSVESRNAIGPTRNPPRSPLPVPTLAGAWVALLARSTRKW